MVLLEVGPWVLVEACLEALETCALGAVYKLETFVLEFQTESLLLLWAQGAFDLINKH